MSVQCTRKKDTCENNGFKTFLQYHIIMSTHAHPPIHPPSFKTFLQLSCHHTHTSMHAQRFAQTHSCTLPQTHICTRTHTMVKVYTHQQHCCTHTHVTTAEFFMFLYLCSVTSSCTTTCMHPFKEENMNIQCILTNDGKVGFSYESSFSIL